MSKLLLEFDNLKTPMSSETEKMIVESTKKCSGLAFFWNKGDHGASSIHSVDSMFLASIIADLLNQHKELRILLRRAGVI